MKPKDEFDDEEFEEDDEWLLALGEMIARAESGVFLAVPAAVRRVERVARILPLTIGWTDTAITCKLHQPSVSMGCVSITGKDILVTNPALFAELAKSASNLEVYPKTDGTIQMSLSYHDLAQKVGDLS